MRNEIFIKPGERLTLEQFLPIASQTMSLIAGAAENVNEINETFPIADLTGLLNKICVHMRGEFEVHRTPSDYYQIVYNPHCVEEAEFDEGDIVSNFVDPFDHLQDTLWINEQVVKVFINRNLYGVAFMLYFYLGYLMTQDIAFGLSHNISFEKILESCDVFPEGFRVKYPTTLMRALADLQDAGLVRWNVRGGTFEVLHITPYDPNEKV